MNNMHILGEKNNQLEQRIIRIVEMLKGRITVKTEPIQNITYLDAPYKKGNEMPSLDGFMPFNKDQRWGGKRDRHTWFHTKINVGDTPYRVELRAQTQMVGWDACNPQFMLYVNGAIKQGMDINHTTALITERGEIDVFLYGYTGINADCDKLMELYMAVEYIDEEVEGLYYDLSVLQETVGFTPLGSGEYYDILTHVNNAINLLDMRDLNSEEFINGVKAARKYLSETIYSVKSSSSRGVVSCFGHTHIDLAWLWPARQTVEKAQRSFATVCALMDRYPDYKFMSSQVPLYKMVKQEDPELFSRIKARVAEGRWEPEGGMYCEADCNLTGGEGLVRQFLYGKRFFQNEFGIDSKVLWLPDVFGYSSALPQILNKVGITDFVTSKISWNETNTIPYDLFTWRGIDGSEVLTHFITAQNRPENGPARYTTYVGWATPDFIKGTYERFGEKMVTENTIATIGYGDGGGGSTPKDCESVTRMEKGLPNLPEAKWASVAEYMDDVRKSVNETKYLPKWTGELYLEFHRGTYTSQAKNKAGNRKSEFLLQNVEGTSVIAREFEIGDIDKTTHDTMWETVLFDQFHDILPGSSINEVYRQTDKDYAMISEYGNTAIRTVISNLAGKVAAKNGDVLVYNPTGFEYSGTVNVDGKRVFVRNIPSKGYAAVTPTSPEGEIIYKNNVLENDFYKLTFDNKMNIVSAFDKKNDREMLKNGEAIRFVAYEDLPKEYDAWELPPFHKEKPYFVDDVTSVKEISDCDRAGIEVTRVFGKSTITDRVWLYCDRPIVEFEDDADWYSKHVVLKREFPVDILAENASCDTQFGFIERPTHKNTSWDWAKFEVCAHKYVDISEGNYGVALMNESKFGHGVSDNVISISLLRGPEYPDPDCDMGKHSFSYALMGHSGNLSASDVLKEATFFNNPCIAVPITNTDSTLPASFSVVKTENEGVVIDTVKPAEDGNGTVIRMYEGKKTRGNETLTIGIKAEKAYLCDLLENELSELEIVNGTIALPYKPFEIITVKVK